MNDWITLDALGKFAFAVALVRYLVEYTKDGVDVVAAWFGARFKREWHVPTRLYAYIVAMAVLLVYHALIAGITKTTLFLDVLNGFLVAIMAGFMQKADGGVYVIGGNGGVGSVGTSDPTEGPTESLNKGGPMGFVKSPDGETKTN